MFNRLQAVALQGVGATAVRLGPLVSRSRVQLDGFKSRALRAAKAATQRNLYATEWRSAAVPPEAAGAPMLVLSDVALGGSGIERLRSTVPREDLAAKLGAAAWSAVAAAVSMQRGQMGVDSLFALEVALALVQTQATKAPSRMVWLLTTSSQLVHAGRSAPHHGGSWGLARSARNEAQLPLRCLDGSVAQAQSWCGDSLAEPELVLRPTSSLAPRCTSSARASPGCACRRATLI